MNKRKREAAWWFKRMLNDQVPARAPYAGFAAFGIELGIPSRVSFELAYSFVSRSDVTVQEINRVFEEERLKWC